MDKKIQYEYEQLEAIVREFQDLSSDLQQTYSRVSQKMDALEGGGWKGQAADRFYDEMKQLILPALKRAPEACDLASDRVRQSASNMKGMEDQLKSVMQRFVEAIS